MRVIVVDCMCHSFQDQGHNGQGQGSGEYRMQARKVLLNISALCCLGAGIIVCERKRRTLVGCRSVGYERGLAMSDRDCTSILCWDAFIDSSVF